MTRILLRAGKDPFTPVVAEATLTQDVFNSNSGNYLFQHAVWKSLSTPGTELVANSTLSERRRPRPEDAARVDEEFDHLVIPLANAFRPEFTEQLDRLAELIEHISIPVTVVGVGAQTSLDLDTQVLKPVDESARRFVRAVLDRSASIGVRGEFTRDYLANLGFPQSSIDVIGCPSLFLHGPDLRVTPPPDSIGPDSSLAINLTPEIRDIGAFATDQAEQYPNLVYVAQDGHDLRLLLWGVPFPHVQDPAAPVHLDHPLYRNDQMRLYLDSWTWFDGLAARDFVYGTRFHGNVAALVAGTPAMLLAHDSRTLELARYHAMPHLPLPDLTRRIRVEDLAESTDVDAFNAAMPERFARYCAFLERNGLQHIWSEAGLDPSFDMRLAEADFPAAVRPLSSDVAEVAARLEWLRMGMVFDITRHPKSYRPPFPFPPWAGAGSRHHRREELLDATRADVATLRERVEYLESRRLRARLGRLRRRLTGR